MQNSSPRRLVLNQESLRNLNATRPARMAFGETDRCETQNVNCPDSGTPYCPQPCSLIRQEAAR